MKKMTGRLSAKRIPADRHSARSIPSGISADLPEIAGDAQMAYPRVCAHRGFNTVAPENSLAAFGAAVALGAEEIELDVRFTRDRVPVVAHDSKLERVSDGTGLIEEKTLAELNRYDFGGRFSPRFAGMKIVTFEEVLQQFSRRAVWNLHLKNPGDGLAALDEPYPAEQMEKIVELLYAYGQQDHVYFMGAYSVMKVALEVAPEIARCMGAYPEPMEIVDRALEYRCGKVQFFLPYMDQAMIDRAHANRIRCNLFYCDDPVKAEEYLAMGIDTILTNDYWSIARTLKAAAR